MATRKDSISLRIKTVVEGLKDIDKLVAQIDTLGGESTETSDEVKALNREFAQLQKQQRTIDEFNRLDASIAKTERDLAKARDRASEVAEKFKAATNPTKALTREYERAADTQNRLEQEQKAQLRTLDGLTNRMKAAGIDTGRLTAEQVRLNASMTRVRGQSDDLTKKLSTIRDGYRQAGTGADEFGRKGRKAGDDVGKGFSSISDKIRSARNLVLGFFGINLGAGMVKDLIKVSDEWKNINARLKLAADSQEEFTTSQAEAFRIAQDSKTGLTDVANLYARLHTSLKDQNTTQAQTLTLTEAITKAMKVSGASTAETSATIQQFIQGMQSGVLRGEEFNSMMEQGPRLAKALADGLDVPVTSLRAMAEQGELTAAKVRDALLSQADVINSEFAELPRTVEGAVSRLSNAWTQFIGQTNDSKGATDVLAQGIEAVASNLEEVANTALLVGETFAAVYAVKGVNAARLYVAELIAANAATIEIGNSSALVAGKIGKIEAAAKLAGAAFVGWEVGTYLREQFVAVERAGIALASGLHQTAERARFAWELAAAAFTDDTLAAATQRHEERLAKIRDGYAELFIDAGKANDEIGNTGAASEKSAVGIDQAGQKTKALADENERLAQQLATISILEQQGVVNAQAAAAQKQEVIAKLQELNASTQQATLSEKELATANKEAVQSYVEKIRAATDSETASNLLSEAAKQLGNDVNSVAQVSSAAAAQITKLAEAETKAKGSTVELADNLLELAAQYRLGEISAAQYWEQTKKITEEAKANKSAADDTSAALKEVGSAAETAGQQMAEGGGGGSDIMRARMEAARDAMAELSNAASEVFESLVKVINKSHATTRDFTNAIAAGNPEIAQMEAEVASLRDELSRLRTAHILASGESSKWLNSVAIAAVTVKREYLEQSLAAERLAERLKGLDAANIQQLNSLERTIDGFNLLDESDLSSIRSEISRLRSEQEALNGSIETTLRSLQDEFDRLNDNQAGIELRDFQNKLAELQEQLDAARKANNQVGVTNASEAIRILRQVHAEKMRQIEDENRAQNRPITTTPTGAQSAREVVEVNFGLSSGGTATGTFSRSDGAAFLDEMRQYANTGLSAS